MPGELSLRRPKGRQLFEIIEDYASRRDPGVALPSERELARHFGVGRMTVRNELDRLEARGLVERVRGRGTFVARPKISQTLALEEPGDSVDRQLLSQRTAVASEVVARHLELSPAASVVLIEELILAGGAPSAVERAFVSSELFPGFEGADLSRRSHREVLSRDFGVESVSVDQRGGPVLITGDDARLLNSAAGVAGFLLHQVARDSDDRAVEYARTLYRGDRYEVRSRVERSW
jgi:GntR family transcriptional regulator